MMLTSVSSICSTIESNSERSAENFIVDLARAGPDFGDTVPKFRATSARPSRAVAKLESHSWHQDSAREMKALIAIFVHIRFFGVQQKSVGKLLRRGCKNADLARGQAEPVMQIGIEGRNRKRIATGA